MGVRFACHACGKHLNIKQELAGRRGVCPNCEVRFRIPLHDAAQSSPITQAKSNVAPAVIGSTKTNVVDPLPAHSAANASPDMSATHPSQAGTAVAKRTSGVSSLELIESDPDATWYVRPPTGGQYGPANGEVLRQWIGEGRVASNALLWRDGWPQWREASEALPELQNSSTQATPPLGRSAPEQTEPTVPLPAPAASQQPVPESQTSQASAPASHAATDNNFGYEDSDFAGGGTYTSIKPETPNLTGRETVGAHRRDRDSKRTLSILLLAIVALGLVVAILYLVTR